MVQDEIGKLLVQAERVSVQSIEEECEVVAEIEIEELSIDGICGVY